MTRRCCSAERCPATITQRKEDADPVPQSKCAQHTLAVNLTPGMYNIEMTGVDSVRQLGHRGRGL